MWQSLLPSWLAGKARSKAKEETRIRVLRRAKQIEKEAEKKIAYEYKIGERRISRYLERSDYNMVSTQSIDN